MATHLSGYELTLATRTDWSDSGLDQFKDKLTKIIKDHDGELVISEDWGRKKLAYPIRNETRARYTHLVFTGNPKTVAEVERNIRLQDKILRFMSVRVAEEFDAAQYQKSRDQLKEQIEQARSH